MTTMRYRLTVSGLADGAVSPLVTVEGESDTSVGRGRMRIEPRLAGAGALAGGEVVEAITDGSVVYLRGDGGTGGTDAVLDGLLGTSTGVRWPSGDRWLRVEVPDRANSNGFAAALLVLLSNARAAWALGDGVVDGRPVQFLRVALNPPPIADGDAPGGFVVADDVLAVAVDDDGFVRSLEAVLTGPAPGPSVGPGGSGAGPSLPPAPATARLVVRWEAMALGDPVEVSIPPPELIVDP
jgi:hypothetical protein